MLGFSKTKISYKIDYQTLYQSITSCTMLTKWVGNKTNVSTIFLMLKRAMVCSSVSFAMPSFAAGGCFNWKLVIAIRSLCSKSLK